VRTQSSFSGPKPAKVSLLGAGPGAADLLTMRGYQALLAANVVVHDALISPDILALIPGDARTIEVGKRGHRVSTAQSFINRLMVRLAKAGGSIVRLKGGDPSIFGRSSEEIDFLERAGIQVEIIPGVTTASAAAAQFGFSLTKRGVAQRVIFATGRTAFGTQEEWSGALDPTTTLCIYMGCGDIEMIAATLIERGRAPSTPALVAYNVGRDDSILVSTILADLPACIAQQNANGPGLIIIGDVCHDARHSKNQIEALCTQLTRDMQVA
jgi:uroporphyrin-III C-methyltransferase